MSATIYFRQSTISAAKRLDTATPEGFMETLENAFEKREPTLRKSDIPVLFGILCARKVANLDFKPFQQLIDALEKYDEVDVFSQY